MAQRKNKTSGKKRSSRKVLDAFAIAERAENQSSSGESGDENDIQDGILDARRFLKDGGNGEHDKFDDEELDSDEALGSDDDYDVLNSKFSQTIRDKAKKAKERERKRKRGELESDDESSEEEAYDSVDESQLVTLSEAWDMDDRDLKRAQKSGDNELVLDEAWESEESEEDDDSESESDSDDGEEQESESDVFEQESDGEVDLKNTVEHLTSQLKKPAKERKRLVTETIAENEFSVPTGTKGLSLQDMMSAVDESVSKDAILIDQDPEKSKALATPLPKRIQERHDRKVAYEISKEEVSKWHDTVMANREAEVLKFPMGAPSTAKGKNTVNIALDDETKNKSELESKISSVLAQSALEDDTKEATFEQIQVAKLSPSEMIKRTNELRLMRELMFRDEAKAKRIKKIKSKQYHKIKKKERMRNAELVEEDESDGEDHDLKRAKERMTLKHKTQSQWAKSMIKSGLSKDANNRAELEEMLRQGERLRAKQLGYEDGDQSDENISDIEKEYRNEENAEEPDRSKLGKGVLAMDFMKNAEQRRKQENMRELEELKRFEANGGLEEEGEATSVSNSKNQGRRVYAPNALAMRESIDEMNKETAREVEDDESSNLVNKMKQKYHKDRVIETEQAEETKEKEKEAKEVSEDESNPWLSVSSEPKKASKITAVDQTSSKLAKSAAKIAKSKKRKHQEGEDVTIDMQQQLLVNRDSDDEATLFSQADLIKQAFAGDDVVAEFDEEKRQVVEDEDDKEEDVTLPGWGDWAGANVTNKKKRKVVRTIDGVAQKDKRKDKNLKNVIINEKVNKKNLKYQSSDVPYPFETREQYERSLRMPIGQQWTSRETHQRLTMPRIIKKQGTVIDPLKAPFK